ncbi:TrbI/VirB10 family protein [Shinella daejeonensis]|uniref:TrbI/VirB10 family protein n=1 Tax=Shinella daejeonensis TaxID=659017 RepID=UPI0020C7ED7D|nr:TrbI/VirB10 family protein [Shinella daejeonensis]MCP8897451.1 TrbI/VirB10 family protein [Shinella daejeonensis]
MRTVERRILGENPHLVAGAGLAGADFSYEVDWADHPGAITARTGETIIVIDSRKGAAVLPPLATRVEALIAELVDAGQERMPGDRRLRARANSQGLVTMSDEEWQSLQSLASNEE